MEQKADKTNSELINAVDSLLDEIEETTQSFEPKKEKAIESDALIGDIGELPISSESSQPKAPDESPQDADPVETLVADSITNAQQALEDVESQAGDLVSQSLDTMLDGLDEPVSQSAQAPVPDGTAEIDSLAAEIGSADLLDSIDTAMDQIDEIHTNEESSIGGTDSDEPEAKTTTGTDESTEAPDTLDELEDAVEALLELDHEQTPEAEAEAKTDKPDAVVPEEIEAEALVEETTGDDAAIEDLLIEESLIQDEIVKHVSSADALDDSMDLLDNALAEAADDMLEGDFETEEGELVSGDAVNSDIEQALQDKPTPEPDPEISDDAAGDLLDRVEKPSDKLKAPIASEPVVETVPETQTESSPKTAALTAPEAAAEKSEQETETKAVVAEIDPEVQSEIEALEELQANEPITVPTWFERTIETIRPKVDRFDPLKGKTMDAVAMVFGAGLVAVITHAAPLGASGMILVSKPLANKSPEVRNAVGYIAMWTGFLAIVLWVYLLMFRSPSTPTPETAPTRVISADEPIVVRPVIEVLP